VRRELERIEVPGEHEARERSWELVRAAYRAREPVGRRVGLVRPLLAAAALVLVAAALSPPGRAVLDAVRETIAEDESQGLTLPAPGRLLVESTRGAWIVSADGAKRFLGPFRDPTWSPHGLYVGAVRGSELVAVDPKGTRRWGLPDRRAAEPRWAPSGFRIAYLARDGLRVVAGDGTGDRLLDARSARVAPAWRPGAAHVLAYADAAGRVTAVDVDSRRRLWRTPAGRRVAQLEWSTDGRRLLVRRARFVDVLTAAGAPWTGVRIPNGVVTAAAFRPGSHGIAVAYRKGGRTQVFAEGVRRILFAGAGDVDDLVWSPNGRWLLVSWSAARQWVFVRAAGRPRVLTASSLERQFEGSELPEIGGWTAP